MKIGKVLRKQRLYLFDMTVAPALLKPVAISKPIPLEAPVTIIILFFNENNSSI